MAAQWLEQGQSVVWGQFLQVRTPLDELKEKYPLLSQQLQDVSFKLEFGATRGGTSSGSMVTSDQSMLTQYHSLALEREKILSQIHGLPGFEKFMLPKDLTELLDIAKLRYPLVMLNLSQKGCDSLIFSLAEVQHLPLPEFTYKKAWRYSQYVQNIMHDSNIREQSNRAARLQRSGQSDPDIIFKEILADLWTNIVEPIIKFLGLTVSTIVCLFSSLYSN